MLKCIFFFRNFGFLKKSPLQKPYLLLRLRSQNVGSSIYLVGILSKTLVFLYLLYRLRNKIMGCHADFFFFLFFSAQNSSSVELRRWLSSFLLQGARKLQRSCTHKIRVWWVSSPSCDKIKVTRNSSITCSLVGFIYTF